MGGFKKQGPRLYTRIFQEGWHYDFNQDNNWEGELNSFTQIIDKWIAKSEAIDMKPVRQLWTGHSCDDSIPLERLYMPFENTWFETNASHDKEIGGYLQDGKICHYQKVKSLRKTEELLLEEAFEHKTTMRMLSGSTNTEKLNIGYEKADEIKDKHVDWVTDCEGYVYTVFNVTASQRAKPYFPQLRFTFLVDIDGSPIKTTYVKSGVELIEFWMRSSFDPEIFLKNSPTYNAKDKDERWHKIFDIFRDGCDFLRMLCLLNVRNISLKNIQFNNHQRKLIQRKTNKAKYGYKILMVTKPGVKKECLNPKKGEITNIERPLHLVRGHLAHYKWDKPLFGISGLCGNFWIPAHTRGNVDVGISAKDYEINSPRGA